MPRWLGLPTSRASSQVDGADPEFLLKVELGSQLIDIATNDFSTELIIQPGGDPLGALKV